MKQQTFEEFLREKYEFFYEDYEGCEETEDESSDNFNQWIAELDTNKVIEYAERWGTELKHVYSLNVISEILNKK